MGLATTAIDNLPITRLSTVKSLTDYLNVESILYVVYAATGQIPYPSSGAHLRTARRGDRMHRLEVHGMLIDSTGDWTKIKLTLLPEVLI
jgi:hypothetical protein